MLGKSKCVSLILVYLVQVPSEVNKGIGCLSFMGGQRALSYYSQDTESITSGLGLLAFLKEIRKHDWLRITYLRIVKLGRERTSFLTLVKLRQRPYTVPFLGRRKRGGNLETNRGMMRVMSN